MILRSQNAQGIFESQQDTVGLLGTKVFVRLPVPLHLSWKCGHRLRKRWQQLHGKKLETLSMGKECRSGQHGAEPPRRH